MAEVIEIKELEDGGALLELDFSKEETERLVQYAILRILEDAVKKVEEEQSEI